MANVEPHNRGSQFFSLGHADPNTPSLEKLLEIPYIICYNLQKLKLAQKKD